MSMERHRAKRPFFWAVMGVFWALGASVGDAEARRLCRIGSPDKAFMAAKGGAVLSLAFSRDGKMLAAGTRSGRLLIYRISKTSPPASLKLQGAVRAIWFVRGSKSNSASSAKTLLAVGGEFGLRLLEIVTSPSFKVKRLLVLQRKGVVMALAQDPKGIYLASSGRDRKVTLWSTSSWKKKRSFGGHTSWVGALVFSRNGKQVFSGGWDNTVRAYRVRDGKKLWVHYKHKFAVNALVMGDKGKTVYSVSDDGRLRRIRVSDGKDLKRFRVGPATGLGVVRKAGVMALATWRGRIKLLAYPRLKLIRSLRASSSRIRCLAVSPKGLVAVGGDLGAVKLWALPPACLRGRSPSTR